MTGPQVVVPIREMAYVALRDELAVAVAAMESVGIKKVRQGRFGEYLRLITMAAEAAPGERIPLSSASEDETFAEAVSQTLQLLSSQPLWPQLEPELLATKLAHVTSGRSLPPSGDEEDDVPRNILLELVTGAHLWSRNFEVSMTSSAADIEVHAEGTRIIVECKRPASENSFDKNVKKACRQLRRADPDTKTMLVLGIDRLARLNRGLLRVTEEQALMDVVRESGQLALQRVQRWTHNREGAEVDLVGLIVCGAFWVRETETPLVVNYAHFALRVEDARGSALDALIERRMKLPRRQWSSRGLAER